MHDLTGLYSVYAHWRNIEIMFHVSTLLPYEKHDPQKVRPAPGAGVVARPQGRGGGRGQAPGAGRGLWPGPRDVGLQGYSFRPFL